MAQAGGSVLEGRRGDEGGGVDVVDVGEGERVRL
jgi:hypothetical protein